MQVQKHAVVTIDYKLTDPEGTLLDSSEGREPLAYIQGAGNIIPGLEKALEGKAAGENVDVVVAPEEGYGVRDDNLEQQVPGQLFEGVDDIQPGMQFRAQTDGGVHIVTVKSVEGDQVTIDGNHPLAGVTLHFAVNVVDVREATEEELEHGHAHGEGGHQH